jgi:hypothetical protein
VALHTKIKAIKKQDKGEERPTDRRVRKEKGWGGFFVENL